MLELAIALQVVLPLANIVFSGIVGGVAYGNFKRLWDLPRKDVTEKVIGTGEGWLTELSTAELKQRFALRKEAVTQ
jgi:hypothetical protein